MTPASEVGVVSEVYEARLARRILDGGPDSASAARLLLEHVEPATLAVAFALVGEQGPLNEVALDCIADAWETYRLVMYQGWD